MTKVAIKSLFFSLISILFYYLARIFLRTDLYLSDVGGIGTFATVFGTLYGIMAAFVIFEVWNQFSKTLELVNQEGQGLERLFRLTLYFKDNKLTQRMKRVIKDYASQVIEGKFGKLALGERNSKTGIVFRKIFQVIQDIKFDDDHDQIIFGHIVAHYGHLSEIRTLRINQSLERLPVLLKIFIYSASLVALITFIVMPFSNPYYGFFTVGALGFILAMVYQLIEDLDNPFVGHWNITPEPFERALKHIEEDY